MLNHMCLTSLWSSSRKPDERPLQSGAGKFEERAEAMTQVVLLPIWGLFSKDLDVELLGFRV